MQLSLGTFAFLYTSGQSFRIRKHSSPFNYTNAFPHNSGARSELDEDSRLVSLTDVGVQSHGTAHSHGGVGIGKSYSA
ncbi:hypothetical protein BOTBODRAFT_50253 [Botryobasidium botryosum FD-172 SS1]|uniref:Uncharacterized protein n=1 Tax=Botryobasidium botryosum (strain FD-172 SS1) TaxID=930990 RepID=A0A067N0Y6_BOTB1|nr:hypothetical protein BOTBODRAFT_50253 [Botryobasidium botryosum FD-172 SS1]